VQRTNLIAPNTRPIPISLILLAAVVVHLPLLLMKLPLKSYDTNFHIFFASHYVHHWFNPWNPKWYAGFSQTTYPPLPQQWVALVSRILGLDMAYMAVQLAAILLLVAGRLPVFSALGKCARRVDCGSGERFSRFGKLPGLFRRAVGHHVCGADLFERPAISLRVGQAWQVAIVSESECTFHGCCCRAPCHPALWVGLLSQCPSWPW
jgi:hypothetical protein